ncbi:hypothetical protein [Neptuniibacter sp.]|uniref:hypothetical protein n=1 Tax=Neptuniibacter sp. TaxID=1962643 RepID=UPI00260967C4|nr:hypothetical protein [Neptuniibacter sp.]MCP4597026.1 hypothetical protein [Neptuniibacter sp.]
MELTEIRTHLVTALDACSPPERQTMIEKVEQSVTFLNGSNRKGNVFIFQNMDVQVAVIGGIVKAMSGIDELMTAERVNMPLKEEIAELTRTRVLGMLDETGGAKTVSADRLGIPRKRMTELCKKYGV